MTIKLKSEITLARKPIEPMRFPAVRIKSSDGFIPAIGFISPRFLTLGRKSSNTLKLPPPFRWHEGEQSEREDFQQLQHQLVFHFHELAV